MFPGIALLLRKVPAKMWFLVGGLFATFAFLWVLWMFAQADAKKDAAVALSKAQVKAAEKYASDTAKMANDFAAAQQGLQRTERIVIKESADARREIEAAPGAGDVVDLDAWRAARGAILRMRKPAKGERSDPAPVAADPAKP